MKWEGTALLSWDDPSGWRQARLTVWRGLQWPRTTGSSWHTCATSTLSVTPGRDPPSCGSWVCRGRVWRQSPMSEGHVVQARADAFCFLVCRRLSSLCLLTCLLWARAWGSRLSGVSSYQGLNPRPWEWKRQVLTTRQPLNSLSLGVRVSIYEFWGGHKHAVYNSDLF